MTAGSRGDVAPFTGLGHALVRAGHEVTLVTHERFAPLVTGSGVAFHPLPVDPRAELESERGRGLHHSASGPGKLLRAIRLARAVVGDMTDGLLSAARHADALLAAAPLAPLAHTIAEGLSLPILGLHLQPIAPTREFAPPMLGGGSWGALGNRLAGHGVERAVDQVFAPVLPAVRARLDLPARGPRSRDRRIPSVLHGFSPLLVPRPHDWRPGLDITGYWWPYEREQQLPSALREFLDAGPPPVFVGLGSATVPDPHRLSAEIVRALRLAGLRGVIQRGWAGLAADGDDILTVDEVPHSLLFPETAAVVHHCGAGTTAAGVRAGVPAVPVPIQFDEGFWADRLVTAGVAPGTVPLRRLTAEPLAAALTRATHEPRYTERARELGARVRAEDGAGRAVEAVNRME
ncbi:glycosyltransferase [Streptomyces griseoruber]|uniref:UDP-glucose--sterol glucosyltransferase n=1 Tax=Streptomyces griseoruber TaxID=1943 RepID=A0A101T5W6_9ACTN|nr:glycosyltransferase [Streptomyces griseoruber]KUN86465.1 UDP-glucose--sterol glucosyltransferase [Streptomyces griseoruber]